MDSIKQTYKPTCLADIQTHEAARRYIGLWKVAKGLLYYADRPVAEVDGYAVSWIVPPEECEPRRGHKPVLDTSSKKLTSAEDIAREVLIDQRKLRMN